MFQWIAIILLPFLPFCSIAPASATPPDYLVRQIEIAYNSHLPPVLLTESAVMEPILRCLREVRSTASISTQPADAVTCTLTLTHFNGRHTVYQQSGIHFLQRNDGAWCSIDPELGFQLMRLTAQSAFSSAEKISAAEFSAADSVCYLSNLIVYSQ